MRVSSWRGLPTVILASRSRTASMTASADEPGTITRRMAVHFWPALTVISATTPLTNRSNSGSSTATSGPSTEQLSESASTPSCTPPCITLVWVRSIPAVWAEPVKATESCTVSSSSRPAGLPHSSWSAPSGRMPDSTMRRTASSVR